MRNFYAGCLFFLVLSCSGALAQLDANSTADEVLNALRDSGKNLKSFSATVKVNDFDAGTGAETNRFGRVWFEFKPDGTPIMKIVLDRKQAGDKKPIPDKIQYLLDDGWMTDRTDATKTESRIQVVPAGQKVDLFQLGKSPFPMPIGQDPAEIRKQFDITRVAPIKDDPPGTIHLLLKPKPASPMAARFFSIDIWTDSKSRMPVRIKTIDSKQAREKTADLTDLQINPALKNDEISLPPLPPDWRTEDIPLAQ